MKKTLQISTCALGSGLIGFFSNQLDSISGCIFFTIGICMLVTSILFISKQDKGGNGE